MSDWQPIFVLPNIALEETIEFGPAILASSGDARVKALSKSQPSFRAFSKSFRDNFRQKIDPAFLLIHSTSGDNIRNVEPLASIRDAIAASIIPYSRALTIKRAHHSAPLFANTFEFYPWMLDKEYKYLIGSTPAFLGMHSVDAFQGQSSAVLFRTSIRQDSIDNPLLAALLTRWKSRYDSNRSTWQDRALFRSLNMALHASMLPAAGETNLYDVGRLISLWVSAFEILVHPGGNNRADRDKVCDLLDGAPSEFRKLKEKTYPIGVQKTTLRTLSSHVYASLLNQRNNFLHGNPVDMSNLKVAGAAKSLFEYAASLYRMALAAFLELKWQQPLDTSLDAKSVAIQICEEIEFLKPQRAIEEALITFIG